jgi:hypothetical protein
MAVKQSISGARLVSLEASLHRLSMHFWGGLRREGKSPGALKVGHQAAEKSTISLEEM